MSKTLTGISVCGDLALAPIFYCEQTVSLPTENITDSKAELARLEKTLKQAKQELLDLYEKTLQENGPEKASIFEVHKMMLEDPDFCDSIKNYIENKENIFQAVQKTSDNFSKIFADMDDPYMQARAADVKDICGRLISILLGKKSGYTLAEPSIILAKDLTPSQVMTFDEEKIAGFALQEGSANSHASILAKANGITTVINLKEIDSSWNGKTAILNAKTGTLIIEPTTEQIAQTKQELEVLKKKRIALEKLKGTKAVTKDGKTIKLYANIASIEDIDRALKQDAEGFGLFRTEFTYLKSNNYPTEETLFNVYKNALTKANGKEIVFRTLDIGADKTAPYFNLPKEENPALGLRAIRLCLTRPALLKTQLRAILKASVFGNALIMFPMIISVPELDKALALLAEVKKELRAEGVTFKENIPVGIMIETPAAALISDDLAPKVDFFSIGTNDLTQYTCAIDRQNRELIPFLDTHHKAVLRLIEMTVNNAHKYNKWVGICGELGSDITLTETFLRIGIDELSLTPSQILAVKQKVQSLDLRK